MESKDAIPTLAALAQETRLDIFRLLVEAGPAGLPAGRIGERLGLALPTLSFHLSQLKHAGLATARRDSRSIIYTANYAAMNGLVSYLTENCCGGDAALCRPAERPSAIPSEGEASHEAPARARRR